MDKVKDFFHDFSDIFFAILVASIMFIVLASNLGSWFNKPTDTRLNNNYASTAEDVINKNLDIENKNDNQLQTEDTHTEDTNNGETENNNENQPEAEAKPDKNEPNSDVTKDNPTSQTPVETKRVVIPSGTFSAGIGKILEDSGLVDKSGDFVRAAEDLGLANKLKAGSFEVPLDATLEDMAKIIAGQKSM